MTVVIIGAGMAGYNFAKEFRKKDTDTPLMILTSDAGRFYSKPLISRAYTDGKDIAALTMKTAEQMAEELNATVHTGVTVGAINPEQQSIEVGMTTHNYENLVLALGAAPIELPLEGNATDEIWHVNDLDDYEHFREALSHHKRLLILGNGLVGCEFANDCLSAGVDVTVVAPDEAPLARLVPAQAGRAVQQALGEAGVQWQLGCAATAINRTDAELEVTLDNGDVLTADIVLSAVGLRPRIALAEKAGLATKHGIMINAQCQTSDPHIYALGDCVEYRGIIKMYVPPLLLQARTLAAHLAGEAPEMQYPVMPIKVKTSRCPVAVVPPMQAEGEWQIEVEGHHVRAEYRSADGRLLGFALTGEKTQAQMELVKQISA